MKLDWPPERDLRAARDAAWVRYSSSTPGQESEIRRLEWDVCWAAACAAVRYLSEYMRP